MTLDVAVTPPISVNNFMGLPMVNTSIPINPVPIANLEEPTRKFNPVVTQEYHPYTPAIPIVLKN